MRKGHIYSLQCPDSFDVRYIGGTILPKERYQCHLLSPKHANRPLQRWIASLQDQNKQPIMSILYTCEKKDISKYEHKFYELYINLGCNLFNEKGYKEQHDIIDTEKLTGILHSKNIKVSVVAEHLGYNCSSISSYLKYKSTINIEKAKRLNDYILSL